MFNCYIVCGKFSFISISLMISSLYHELSVSLPGPPPGPLICYDLANSFQGRPQDLAGGGKEFFFQIWEFACCLLRMAKPSALLGGFGGMPPREFFLKWCNLVRFGVYSDQILSLKFFLNYHFLYKNLKNCNFFI